MAIELKQSLSLSQQLIMTPQLQQAIKLLQLSRLELLETITQEMEENPVLEEQAEEVSDNTTELGTDADGAGDSTGSETDAPELPEVKVEEKMPDEVDWENYLSEYNTAWAELPYDGREAPSLENMAPVKNNLTSHLLWQLSMSDLDERDREIAVHIIGNLDDDGYLQIPMEEIAETTGRSLERVGDVLTTIQHFDPVGVAARDAQESLLIQARFQGLGGTPVEEILLHYLKEVENKDYDKIAKKLSLGRTELLDYMKMLQNLEPKPGRLYSDEEPVYITPDIYVFKIGDEYEIMLNEDGMPKLHINSYYRDVLSSNKSINDSAKSYIQDKLRSAAWLIKSIHQRQRTIYRVTEGIVRFQRDFLDNGITHLRPLVLRDVAEEIQMHESTVSRVTTNKYVYTPQGVFELKYFFNSSINSIDGEAVASQSVKEHIRNIIKAENSQKPNSDQEIVELLKKKNIQVARRTVAKYRESMGIMPSRRRKSHY